MEFSTNFGRFPQGVGGFPQGELVDDGAREDVKVVGIGGLDAGLNFVVGGGTDHGGIVARETWFGEEAV